MGCTSGIAALDSVIEHDSVVVVDDLGLLAELHRPVGFQKSASGCDLR
jgi:hypothetical protein